MEKQGGSKDRENVLSRLTHHKDSTNMANDETQMKIFESIELDESNTIFNDPNKTYQDSATDNSKQLLQSPGPIIIEGYRVSQPVSALDNSDKNFSRKIMSGTVGKRAIDNQEGLKNSFIVEAENYHNHLSQLSRKSGS